MIPLPPAIIQQVGEGNTPELARLRAIRNVVQPLGVSVESAYMETTTRTGTTASSSILIQVNVNGIPGIEITKEYRKGSTYYAEARFNLAVAQQIAYDQYQRDLEDLTWILNRPRTASRNRGLQRAWVCVQQDVSTCSLLGVEVRVPRVQVEEESRGPKLVATYSRGGSKVGAGLSALICQTYSDQLSSRVVEVQAQYTTRIKSRGNDTVYQVDVAVTLNGNSFTLQGEVVKPRYKAEPTPTQILGATNTQLEELISSF
jgi:hypothetical protein